MVRLSDEFGFYPSLISPIHDRYIAAPDAHASGDEVIIDESWQIRIAHRAPQTELAADDLRQFLKSAMGVEVAVSEESSDRQIVLTVDGSLNAALAEAHLVRVTASEVIVSGASPAGVLHGVVFLEDLMRSRRAPFLRMGERLRRPLFIRRIHRSCMSPFYVEELTGETGPPYSVDTPDRPIIYTGWTHSDAGPDAFYHENILSRLMHHGMNGIWIRGALCKFARVSMFPEFGTNAERIMEALRRLCERASRYGISVYLFFNEPLGLPRESDFWDRHPECKGSYVRYHDRYCMCTSIPKVKEFLREGMAYIFRKVPELGGVILITASEFPTHCYCHVATRPGAPPREEYVAKGLLCERCAEREPQDVVAEVVGLIRDGIRTVSEEAEVIAWNWSWSLYEEDPQEGILEKLPEDVIVMGDFERGIATQAMGFDYQNDEYSLKIIGPSDRFKGMAQYMQQRSRKVFAKIQLGTTHEDGDVPYLPVMERIAAKFVALRDEAVAGLMVCWNFGNMPSLATELAGMMSWSDAPTEPEDALKELAVRHFGSEAASCVVEGWKLISRAMEDFPGSIPVMYYGPVNRGPAYPLLLERVGKPFPRSWLLDVDAEGDDLNSWVRPFGAEHVLKCFRSLSARFAEGADKMLSGSQKAAGDDAEVLVREAGVAQACAAQFRSAANITEFLLVRDRWYDADKPEEKDELRRKLIAILQDEAENCKQVLALVDQDPRLGFHGEAYGYLFNRPLIEAKLQRLQETLATLSED